MNTWPEGTGEKRISLAVKGSGMGFNLLACDLPRKWLLGEISNNFHLSCEIMHAKFKIKHFFQWMAIGGEGLAASD